MNKYTDTQGKKVLAITLMVALVGGVWYVSDQQKLAASEEEIVSEEDEGRVSFQEETIIEEDDSRSSYQEEVVAEEDNGRSSYQEAISEEESKVSNDTVEELTDTSETKENDESAIEDIDESKNEEVSESVTEKANETSNEETVNVADKLPAVTITVNKVEKTYGQKDPQFTCTIDGATEAELGSITYSRVKGENVGTYEITASCTNNQYAITINPGTLTINQSDQNQFEVLVDSLSYNGKEQSALTINTTTEGNTVYYSINGGDFTTTEPRFKNAGTYKVKVKVTNQNYQDLTKDVDVVVSPKKATLTSNSVEKVYDGTALTGSEVEAVGFIDGEDIGLSYDFTGSQLDAGTSKNTFTYTGNTSNYDIDVQYGTLTVTPITEVITIKAGSSGKEYDGTPLSYNGYSYTSGILVNGDVLKATVEGSITNVSDGTSIINQAGKSCGRKENKVVSYSITRDGKDISGNYTVKCEAGTLDIYKKEVTLTVDNTYKVVGQKDPDFTYTVNGLISGDSIGTVTFQRDEGEDVSYKDPLTDGYLIEASCENVNPNYTISEFESGVLYIVPSEDEAFVTVTVKNSTYNGTCEYLSINAPTGSAITYSIDNGKTWTEESPKLKAGTYTLMVKATSDTGTYTFEKDITIAPRNITITAGSGNKLYDGAALKETSAYLTSGSLGNGDSISYIAVNGKQTSVGTSANTITSVVIVDKNGEDVTDNYNITKVNGTLTVTWTGTLPENQEENSTSNTTQNNVTEEKTNTEKSKEDTKNTKEVSIGSTNTGKDLTEKTDNITPQANLDLEEEKNYTLPIIALIIAAVAGFWFFLIGKRRKEKEE